MRFGLPPFHNPQPSRFDRAYSFLPKKSRANIFTELSATKPTSTTISLQVWRLGYVPFALPQCITSDSLRFIPIASSRTQLAGRCLRLYIPVVRLQSCWVYRWGWSARARHRPSLRAPGVLWQPKFWFISLVMNYSSNHLVILPFYSNPYPRSRSS